VSNSTTTVNVNLAAGIFSGIKETGSPFRTVRFNS